MQRTFARIFFGAMSSAGESVCLAEDPEAASDRVEAAIGIILDGLQAGVAYFCQVTLPGPAGTSSIQTWPAGTVMVLPLASRLSVEVSLSLARSHG